MVDDVAVLILPLVHHFVQQGVERLGPSMAANVATADDDLGAIVGAAGGAVVAKTALHPARHAQRHDTELPREMPSIVLRMPGFELPNEGRVGGIRRLPGTADRWRALDRVRQDRASGGGAMRTGATTREGDDRREHRGWCAEERLVDAQLAAAEAHDDGAIAREPAGIEAFQPECAKSEEQFGCRAGWRGELEDELGGIRAVVAEKEVAQRAKHCDAPATKVVILSDQTDVETSMLAGDRVMTFTDDGRPPRDRLETVPAVEMTVPFFVCST